MKFQEFIAEAVSNAQVMQANKLIKTYFTKKMKTEFTKMPGIEEYKNTIDKGFGVRYFYGKNKSIRLNWKTGNTSSSLMSIDLWTGLSSKANYHMEFDGEISLVKVLPLAVEFMKNPEMGAGLFIPDEEMKEEFEYVITESSDNRWDNLMKFLSSNPDASTIDVKDALGHMSYLLFNTIRKDSPEMFSKDGKTTKFIGKVSDLERKKAMYVKDAGGVSYKVSAGGSNEQIEYDPKLKAMDDQGLEKIAYEDQLADLEHLTKLVIAGASNALFIAGRGGVGKAVAHGTGILTPDGWVNIEEIRVGDLVIAQDGTPTEVTGVYPQGTRKTYSVNFWDGRSSIVDAEHLWEVIIGGKSKVMKTHEIKSLIDSGKLDRRPSIPLFSPTEIEDAELPIDPYLLGILIGDGSLSDKSTVGFTSADTFIVDQVKSLIPECVYIKQDYDIGFRIISKEEYRGKKNPFNQSLLSLDLKEKRSFEKHIPVIYKNASIRQKLNLIQGLMDSDGYASNSNIIQFTTTSETLIDDFCEIIWSIGGKAKVSKNKSSYKNKDGIKIECRDAYTATIQYHSPKDLFRLPRKKDRVNVGQYSHVQLPITNIEEFGEVECACIKVEHPRSLFVIDDYICTHNTHTVEEVFSKLGLKDGDGYFKNAGSASAIGIYKLLFKYKDKIVLFDDSDGALADQDSRNIFKAATDTKKVRKLAWNKESRNMADPDDIDPDDETDTRIPKYFEFTGKILFISNLQIDKLDPDGALRTRALMIAINPTDEEVFNLMDKICVKMPLEDGLSLDDAGRREVVDVLRKSAKGDSVNLRKLVRGLNMRAALGPGEAFERMVKLYA